MTIGKYFGRLFPVVSLAAVIVGATGRNVHGCTNFWVNPQTGEQECLDSSSGATSSPEAPSNSSPDEQPGSGEQSPPQGITISSSSTNQQYKDQTFTILPAEQLQPRMPRFANLPEIAVYGSSTTNIVNEQGAATASDQTGQTVAPDAYGTSGVPFSTSRVLGGATNPAQAQPYSRTGKLYMAFGGTTFTSVCSASLIGRSLLLTAAHCVHEYGQGSAGWATKVRFVPAKDDDSEPYEFFESTRFLIPDSYFNGTDTCDPQAEGIVCNKDIALVALDDNASGQQAGDLVGYYGYGWNNYSFSTPSSAFASEFGNSLFAAITQLGYPASHDSGLKMQINTAYGSYVSQNDLENIWLGSAMTGGSSGGPWLVNFGEDAIGANYGNASVRNIVVGVTSWGYTDGLTQLQGASTFGQNSEYPDASYGFRGAGNIGKLVYDACDNTALTDWQLQSRGRCR